MSKSPKQVLVVHRWLDPKHAVIIFLLFESVMGGVLFWIADWQPALVLLTLFSYPVVASCVNRTTIWTQDSRLFWKHGPLPMKRGGKTKLDEIRHWAYGVIPDNRKAKATNKAPEYGVAIVRVVGKLNKLIDGLSNEAEAKHLAKMCAATTKLEVVSRSPLANAKNA